MSGSLDKSSGLKSLLSVQTIVLAGVAWAVLALLFFLLFGTALPGQEHPLWYSLGTSVFELVAFLVAALLCLRNWRSNQIVSGRNVWLFIGLGMFFYFVGGLLFTYWETGLRLDADVSPGDFFYVLTYICLLVGMFQAVFSRRLNLEVWQWGAVTGIAAVGILLAFLVSLPPSTGNQSFLMPPAVAQTAPAKPSPKPTAKPARQTQPKPEAAKPQATSPVPAASPSPAATSEQKSSPAADKAIAPDVAAPQWALDLEKTLAPLAAPINLFYVVCDVILLISATTLLLAFWGGRFSQSWRMIALAAFFLYIADMWYKYATRSPDYQSGSLPEVGWVFSGVLFAIGAALEYDLSQRSRRTGGRRRAGA